VKLLLASRNAGKIAELERIVAASNLTNLQVLGLRDVPEYPEAPETGATFAENALAKARDAVTATGLAAVADDSGLAIDALNGMPGVLSARWAGHPKSDERNNELLLAQLADVPDAARAAHFACAAALALPAGEERVAEGRIDGVVIRSPRGQGGFGYDPVFQPLGSGLTLAEIPAEQKNAVSHRSNAFRALAPVIRELLGL
jgi:XTP/dITP diphosphohydrolase